MEKDSHKSSFCLFSGGHKYISVNGQPHCLVCYQNKHGKVKIIYLYILFETENNFFVPFQQTCFSCGEYISPEEQRITLENRVSLFKANTLKSI